MIGDSAAKLQRISRWTAVASSGTPVLYDNGQRAFAANECIKSYFATRGGMTGDLYEIQKDLASFISHELLRATRGKRLSVKAGPHGELFASDIFHYDRDHRIFQILELVFAPDGLGNADVDIRAFRPENFEKAMVMPFGESMVIEELRIGKRKDFSKERAATLFDRCIAHPLPSADLTAPQSIQTARALIRLTNERMSAFTNMKPTVSKNCDIAVLDSEKGLLIPGDELVHTSGRVYHRVLIHQ